MINGINPKLGFYTVGDQQYRSKIDACIAGTKTNNYPQWQFCDNVWNTANWTHEPEISILDLYKIRARQIREKYDYVIVNYSGGSDSQTLVDAFFDAGCHIDEIVTIWNRSHTPTVIANRGVTDARNIEAEFELTTRMGLDQIRSRSPNTKITYYDVSQATVSSFQNYDGEEWLKTTREHLNPHFVTRYSNTREKGQLVNLDRGLKTAIVVGIDKPRVCIKDNKYAVYFLDTLVNNCQGGLNNQDYDNAELVLFYWSPDLPEIIIKQSHMIMTWFEQNPMLKSILTWPTPGFASRQAYEVISRGIIYPNWKLDTFQVQKSSSPIWCEWDDWFFQGFKDTKEYQCWFKGIEHIEKNIDKKYLKYTFDNKFDGFVGMLNGHFYLQKHGHLMA